MQIAGRFRNHGVVAAGWPGTFPMGLISGKVFGPHRAAAIPAARFHRWRHTSSIQRTGYVTWVGKVSFGMCTLKKHLARRRLGAVVLPAVGTMTAETRCGWRAVYTLAWGSRSLLSDEKPSLPSQMYTGFS